MATIPDAIHIFRPPGADPEHSEMGGQDTCHMDTTYFTENSLKITIGNFTDHRREWRGPLDQLENPSQCKFTLIPCKDSGFHASYGFQIPATVFHIYCP